VIIDRIDRTPRWHKTKRKRSYCCNKDDCHDNEDRPSMSSEEHGLSLEHQKCGAGREVLPRDWKVRRVVALRHAERQLVSVCFRLQHGA
jgi:hypothetical protein